MLLEHRGCIDMHGSVTCATCKRNADINGTLNNLHCRHDFMSYLLANGWHYATIGYICPDCAETKPIEFTRAPLPYRGQLMLDAYVTCAECSDETRIRGPETNTDYSWFISYLKEQGWNNISGYVCQRCDISHSKARSNRSHIRTAA